MPPRDRGEAVSVAQTLDYYQAFVTRELLTYLPRREPRRHLYNLVATYPLRGGKGLRPALCMATCRAFGGSPDEALKSAVALELLHNALLVHDDIQDGTPRRRGRPTLHAEEGVPIALNVGDALVFLSLRPLFDNFEEIGSLAWRVLEEFSSVVQETIEGQAMDLGWIRDNEEHVTVEDYLRMTLKKTSWYTTIGPCRIGTLIASRDRVDLSRFTRFGYFLGAAFQVRDDLLTLDGNPGSGKEADDDLYEGKRTLPMIHLLAHVAGRERELLRRFLGRPRSERRPADVQWVKDRMAEHGSVHVARQCLAQLGAAAAAEFHAAFDDVPETRDKQFLRALVPFVSTRPR